MTVLWTGLTLGAMYGLVAVGYNLVFISSDTFNFANAQLIMLGTFLAYWGIVQLHWPVVLVIIVSALIVAAVAGIEERLAIRPITGTEAHLVTTVGVATILDGAIPLIWGQQPLAVPFFGPTRIMNLLGGKVFPVEVFLIALVVALAGATALFLRRSLIGLALLAISEDREAASLRGINVSLLGLAAFAATGAIAGALGVFVGPYTFAVASLGTSLALYGFVALAMGGFGSTLGGLVGGFAVGLIEAYSSRYAGSAYGDIAVFGVLLAILLTRPTGLFGRPVERRV